MLMFELTILACVLLAGLSVVWSTFMTGISPMPSSSKASQAMLLATEDSGEGTIIDLGSGWGTLVIALARKHPHRHIIGYELSFIPWLASLFRKHIFCINNLSLYRKNFLKAELPNESVLICYLFPGGMVSLHEKLKRDGSSECLIVSNTFALPSCQPTKVIRIKDIYKTPIYIYHPSK